MVKNLIQYLEDLQIVNVRTDSYDKDSGTYQFRFMKTDYSIAIEIEESFEEPKEEEEEDILSSITRDEGEETPKTLSITLNKATLDEQEIILDRLETDENTILTLILEPIQKAMLEAAKKNEIIDLPRRDDKSYGRELLATIAFLSNHILTDTRNRKDAFAIAPSDTISTLINATNQPLFNKVPTKAIGCNLLVNNEKENGSIIVGASAGDFGGLTLCINPERFITYEGEGDDGKTIIRYALSLISDNMYKLYRMITT